ncbi:uncharacterized protein LOC123879569 [Maniola jurtina]|uniref:uncharacterized protein LOC123879569 n=1 Tax=Maniola jurtina TaxID=191418 RepID=UPI001E68D5E2|nr:uncharacterized protein LOC123879569 [Maniola jurtina]
MERSSNSAEENAGENINVSTDEPMNATDVAQQPTPNTSYGANSKRTRQVDEEEIWHEVTRSRKRYARTNNGDGRIPEEKIEISVTSKEPLPKQFAFAHLLTTYKIPNILRVRYLNAYKLHIQFQTEEDLQKLLECENIRNRGWNFQRTLEVGVSYAILRNVELDLTESDILDSITSTAELIAVKRLNRRGDDGLGWVVSETVRLCFKGSSVPAYVYVHGVRTRIDTYTFPVTQCTNCWKYGHPKKVCPKKKRVCPKCTENHENCEATKFYCVNCKGNHMSLNKECPIYAKEKRIREIMAEFNCTYKRALTIYVPPSPPPEEHYSEHTTQEEKDIPMQENADTVPPRMSRSYASAAASHPTGSGKNKSGSKDGPKKSSNKKQKQKDDDINWDEEMNYGSEAESAEENTSMNMNYKRSTRKETEHFTIYELLKRLKNIILNTNNTTFEKITEITMIIFKWITNMFRSYIPDMNFIKNIFNSLWTRDQ